MTSESVPRARIKFRLSSVVKVEALLAVYDGSIVDIDLAL